MADFHCDHCGKTTKLSASVKTFVCGCHASARLPIGLGDIIAIITRYTGIAWLTKRITRGQCGCPQRQQQLNELSNRWLKRLQREMARVRAIVAALPRHFPVDRMSRRRRSNKP